MSVIISAVLSFIIICCTLINIYIFIKSKKLNTRSGNKETKAIYNKNKQGKTLKQNSINSNQPQKKRTDKFGNIEIEDLDGYKEVEISKALTNNGQKSVEKDSSKVKVNESNNIIKNDLVINRDE